jgi:hypothetical protein
MTTQRITKRTVDALKSKGSEFTVWDDAVTGFGVRVRPTGAKSYVVVYRAGSGLGAPVRRYTIAAVGKIAPERARARAKVILGSVAHGHDSADQKTTERGMPTVAELADRFMAEHVQAKRKGGTAKFYRDILNRIVKRAAGTTKADKLSRQVAFVAGRDAIPGEPRAGGGRQHVRLRVSRLHRVRWDQSGARHRQVQGKSPRALLDRRRTGAAVLQPHG